jgi:hypothetical protein
MLTPDESSKQSGGAPGPTLPSASQTGSVSSALERQIARLGTEVFNCLLQTNSSIEPLGRVEISSIRPQEIDFNTIPEAVRDAYAKYASMPKSMAEWDKLGRPAGGWNGVSFRLVGTQHYAEGQEYVTSIEVVETPNKLLQADKDLRKNPEYVVDWGIRQTHVGLITPVVTPKGLALVGQLRGTWVDEGGTVHPLLAAGGFEDRSFGKKRDPIAETLRFERFEEAGEDPKGWQSSKPLYILHEDGQPMILGAQSGSESSPAGTALYCNIGQTARHTDGTPISWDEYQDMFKTYSQNLHDTGVAPQKGEVAGWALIYLDRSQFHVSEDGWINVKDLECFRATADGGVEHYVAPMMRGFSPGAFFPLLELTDPQSSFRKWVLEEAGIVE